MNVTKVGRRGQITLPRAIRQWLQLQEGDQVAFVRKGDEVVLQPLTQTLLELRGTVPVSAPQDFEAIRRQVLETHVRGEVQDET